jgi:SAM-dependent methyltransferase
MVVEHLREPERQFREMARVLRPGGLMLLHTPNALGYPVLLGRALPDAAKTMLARLLDKREAADVFPTQYRANTDRAIEGIAERVGLRVVRMQMVATDAVFALLPPLAAVELVIIRLTLLKRLRRYRADIIATLQKPPMASTVGPPTVSRSGGRA